MVDFANGKIQAFAGPKELGAPNNLERVIVDFIKGAQKTLDFAIQEIDSEKIAQAIIDARWRGVRTRVFIEHDYIYDSKPPEKRAAPVQSETPEEARQRAQWDEYRKPEDIKTNRDIHMALLRNGVDIKADYNHNHIFHQKFIIRDRRTRNMILPSSAILTGSTNFTQTGTHKNLNHIVVFKEPRIAWEYQEEFREIRHGIFGSANSIHESKPSTINIEGVPVQILFAPDHAPELEIVKQVLKCQNRLHFAIFTFSGSSGIDDAMLAIRESGHSIRGVIDPVQGLRHWAPTKWLHNQGIELFLPRKSSKFGKLHHKLMVVDNDIVVAGSMNYTRPANEKNDENIFIIGSPYNLEKKEGGPVDHAACRAIADFFRNEIERIISNLSDPYDK
ncbi:MAG: phospholipase [Candidatus Bathyarchaeota archaeon]|nr:MAG: phospholipase [Candidatus Bathyarchaeota archaeon]